MWRCYGLRVQCRLPLVMAGGCAVVENLCMLCMLFTCHDLLTAALIFDGFAICTRMHGQRRL